MGRTPLSHEVMKVVLEVRVSRLEGERGLEGKRRAGCVSTRVTCCATKVQQNSLDRVSPETVVVVIQVVTLKAQTYLP